MALLRDMPQHEFDLGSFQRQDGETFSITCRFYATPAQRDWIAAFDTQHKTWGHLKFVVIIPKNCAPTMSLARILISGDVLNQMKSDLLRVGASGRDVKPTFSSDGRVLV